MYPCTHLHIHIYIYIYIYICTYPPWDDKLESGWRAVSAERLHGKDSSKQYVSFPLLTDTQCVY